MIARPRGTRDLLEMRLWNYVITTIQAHLHTYNFEQIETPLIEQTSLFMRSLGTYTDVVSKQMFMVQTQSDESLCLRPEATASIVRAFVEENITTTPWKVFLIGPMFRYERPQKGRYRQFYQVSVEIIGAPSYIYDVQLIALLDRLFSERLLMSDYALHINYLGCTNDRVRFSQTLQQFLASYQDKVCDTCRSRLEHNPLRVFDCKNPTCQELYKKAPTPTDCLCTDCSSEWESLTRDLALLSVSFHHNRHLVRGLDYYQKTVFEFVSDQLGAQNAFCAGGRYDQLVGQIGGITDQPCMGAAIGIDRLVLLLEPHQDRLMIPTRLPLTVIIPLEPAQQMNALLLADRVRTPARAVEVLTSFGSIKSLMRKADALGASYVLIIGSEEQHSGTVTVKNMKTGAQEKVAQVQVATYLN